MASCTNIKLLKRNVEDFIGFYESVLQDDSLSQSEVASTEAALTLLRANLEAIENDNRKFLAASGFISQRNEEKSKVFDKAFKEIAGEKFSFRYGRDGNESSGKYVSSTVTDGGIAINIITRRGQEQFTFPLSSTGASLPTKGTDNYIFVKNLEEILDTYEVNQMDPDKLEGVLGSNNSKLHLNAKYRYGDYIHGDKESMKNMVDNLHLLGGSKATEEDLEYYKSLIDDMSKDLFDPLQLYLNAEADKSEGSATGTGRIDIAVKNGPRIVGNQQTEASIYMEETIHSMTYAAIESKTPEANKLKRQLSHTVELARKNTSWEDFLPKESINPEAEQAYAKEIYDYIFSGKNGDHEFLAKGITVPEIRDAFKNIKFKGEKSTKLLDRINDFFAAVMDIIRGNLTLKNKPEDVHQSLVNLSLQLGEINSKASQRRLRATEGVMGHAMDIVNNLDSKAVAKWDNVRKWVINKADVKLEKMPDSYYGRVTWMSKVLLLSFTNPVYRKVSGAVATSLGIKADGTVREIIGGLFATEPAQKVAEYLALQSGKVDKARNNQIDLTRNAVFDGFSSKDVVTESHENAMTSVLMDTGFASVLGKDSVTVERGTRKVNYDNKTFRKLLTDKDALNKRISDVKKALRDYDINHQEWHVNQAVGLGIFMATHKGTPEQNLNAHNIARGIHSSHKKNVNTNVVKAINELSSLVALNMIDDSEKALIADLAKTEWKGVQHVADMVEGFNRNSEESVFKNNKVNMIKGYSKELFDDTIMMEVAPVADENAMKAQGFKKVMNLNPSAGDIRNKPMAMYVTYSASRPDRIRGAARLNQIRAKGQSIRNLAFVEDPEGMPQLVAERGRRDIINIQRAAMARGKSMEQAGFQFNESIYGVVPTLNNSGVVSDYRYMMDKETKKKLLGQDTRISEVLARSYGSLTDKLNTEQHNAKVLEALTKDMEDNWAYGAVGKDGLTEFTEIGPNAETKEGKELYYMLPSSFKEYIKNRQDKTLAVRTALKDVYFGYSNMSIANFAGMQKINPALLTKVIKMGEMWWMEMVKVAKGNILLKTPAVLIGNIMANFISGTLKGYNPVEMGKLYTESYRDINTFNSINKELQTLENTIRSNNVALGKELLPPAKKSALLKENKVNRQKAESLKRRIERDLKHIEEIVNLGLDQNVDDSAEIDSNRITKFFDTQLEKVPELVRDGVDLMFLTKRTAIYKIANEFLEVSDLVARDVQNRIEKKNIEKQVNGHTKLPSWWLEIQNRKGYKDQQRLVGKERVQFLEMAKTQREYDLVEDFINYSKPSGRFEEYLNKVGILMFTKYTKRIQRVILKNSSNHPVKTAVGLLAFGFLGGFPSIHESSFMVKDYYGDSIGAGNIFPVYAPTEVFANFITPAVVKDSTYEF